MAQPTACTPLHVLDNAIEVLSRPDGYVTDLYHARYDPENARPDADVPGMVGTRDLDVATAHCAIGGVEHAMYKVCKRDVVADRHPHAYATTEQDTGDPVLTVFRKVMVALNLEAIRLYGELSDGEVDDVEDVSMNFDKKDVLAVFYAARERLVEEQV